MPIRELQKGAEGAQGYAERYAMLDNTVFVIDLYNLASFGKKT